MNMSHIWFTSHQLSSSVAGSLKSIKISKQSGHHMTSLKSGRTMHDEDLTDEEDQVRKPMR
jgi:hypothetical protein